MARPPKAQQKINGPELLDLMQFYPSIKEAADWFDISISSLERFIKNMYQCSFEGLRDKRFVRTKVAIKRAQIKQALAGNNIMLIWVGKQYLGQSDKLEARQEIHGEVAVALSPSMTKEQAEAMLAERLKNG